MTADSHDVPVQPTVAMRARLDLRIDAELRTWLVKQSVAEARTITHIVERALCNERHATGHVTPAPDKSRPVGTRRPARDATSPEPIGKLVDATGHETPVSRPLTKQELDIQRQRKLNTKKKGMKA